MTKRIVPQNLADLYHQAADIYGDNPAFGTKRLDGEFSFTSYHDLYQTGLKVATALIELGVSAREHVGLISDNRLEWIFCDAGVQLCGAADVPRGTDVTEDELVYILNHADVRVVFVENASVLAKMDRRHRELKQIEHIIILQPGDNIPAQVKTFQSLVQRGAELRSQGDRRAEERLRQVRPEDVFTIIYTSGTTGTPKGVQLTHANMVSQIKNLPFDLQPGDRALSILPVWHSYERVFEMVAISWGACTYYTSLRSIADDLKKVKPTVMASAPRLWENLYQKILANVKYASPLKRALFHAAYGSARKVMLARQFFAGKLLNLEGRGFFEKWGQAPGHFINWLLYQLPYRLLDSLVLKKLRGVVGGEFRGTISGGGALQPHVDEFFNFIGIPVLEGYGMTETAPVLAVRTWDNLVIGTVGAPYPETEFRIVDLNTQEILYPNPKKPGGGRGLRGEIHVKGPQVMKGYYKSPEVTAKVLREGWMNTGDIGMITFNDCVKILGRSKETIVLLSGENVEPVPIESRLVHSPFIDHCMVIGQDQKFLGALIVPSLEGFQHAGVPVQSTEELRNSDQAKHLLDADIRKIVSAANGFKPFERIADWRLVDKPFEVGDEMTQTFKLKRHIISDKYARLIAEIYQS